MFRWCHLITAVGEPWLFDNFNIKFLEIFFMIVDCIYIEKVCLRSQVPCILFPYCFLTFICNYFLLIHLSIIVSSPFLGDRFFWIGGTWIERSNSFCSFIYWYNYWEFWNCIRWFGADVSKKLRKTEKLDLFNNILFD